MPGCCGHTVCGSAVPNSFRRVLWIALIINAAMFGIEMVSGLMGRSLSLQADALDFFADATNYALSLLVLGWGMQWRAGAALFKGVAMAFVGLWVLALAVYHVVNVNVPQSDIMGSVALLALLANLSCAWLLYQYRSGDSNMRSVWLCSRNDAIASVAVLIAASGVWATGNGWPDVVVGAVIAGLGISSAVQITTQARRELRAGPERLLACE